MRAGSLRHRITIQAASTPTSGAPEPTYATHVASLPAQILETGGGEYIRALSRQVEAEVRAVITIRYRSDIVPTMRVSFGGRSLNITSATDPLGTRRKLILTCTET